MRHSRQASIALLRASGVASGWSVLRENVNLAMDGVPELIARNDVLAFLRARPEVAELHDLHIWGLSTTDTALTADLVIAPQAVRDDLLLRLETDIARRERAHPGHPRHQKRARP